MSPVRLTAFGPPVCAACSIGMVCASGRMPDLLPSSSASMMPGMGEHNTTQHRKPVLGQPTPAGTPTSASAAKPTKPPTLTTHYNVLDAAVLQAYQLHPGATPADILTRLLALNAQRAAEEARGTIRWLRPEFQDIQNSLSKPAVSVIEKRRLDADLPQEKSYQNSS